MNWQQVSLIEGQLLPLILVLAALLTTLTGIAMKHSFSRGVLLVILCLAAIISLPIITLPAGGTAAEDSFLNQIAFVFQLERVDSPAGGWLALSTVLVLAILFRPQIAGTFPVAFRREVQGGLLLAAATQGAILSNDAWIQWGLTACTSWFLTWLLARDLSDQKRGKGAAGCLIWLTVADLAMLAGLTALSLVLPIHNLSFTFQPDLLQQLSEGETAVCVSALTLMISSLVLRGALYPFMSWSAPVARTGRDVAWIIGFGLGFAALLLLQWAPLFTFFMETRWMLMGLGGLSALLLSIMAWGKMSEPVRLLHAAGSQFALVWLGVGADVFSLGKWAALALALNWLLPMIVLLRHQDAPQGENLSLRSILLWLMTLLVCVGILGQERVLIALYQDSTLPGLNRWLLLGGAMFSHLLAARVLFGSLRGSPPQEAAPSETLTTSVENSSGVIWLGLVISTLAIGTGVFLSNRLIPGFGPISIVRPDLCGILMLMALIAAWCWPEVRTSERSLPADGWDSLRRLARAEFYVPGMVNFFILLPIRAASQISRFLEWIVFGNLTMKLPAAILGNIARNASDLDDESDEPARMWQLASAAAVMLAGVALGMLL